MKAVAVGLTIFALLATAASADILEWDDADGVRHYTNMKGEVPSQRVAEVVVDEHVWAPQGSSAPVVSEAAPVTQPDSGRDTEDTLLRAYLAGLQSGLASDVGTGSGVDISAPLEVAIPPPTSYGSYVPPGYDWLLAGYPFVTTSLIGRHRGPIFGRFGTGFQNRFQFSQRFMSPAGPRSFGAAGPPPLGAAGPPPLGAAGPPPFGAAGSPLLLRHRSM